MKRNLITDRKKLKVYKVSKTTDKHGAEEELMKNNSPEPSSVISDSETLKLIHELKVHQLQLEMQNEALLLASEQSDISARKYAELYDFAPSGYFKLSRKGQIIELNLSGAKMLGKERPNLINSRFGFFVRHDTLPAFNSFLDQVFRTGVKVTEEVTLVCSNNFPYYVHLTGIATGNDEECLITVIDITERKLISDTQNFLLQSGYPGSEEGFFESLARFLAVSLGMDYVCIDKLKGDGLTAQTVAVYNDGKFEPNQSYSLKETPCGDVVGKNICCFPENVCLLFPNDPALKDLKAESYIGTTLWSFEGKPIGLIAIIGNRPLNNPILSETVIKLVAMRAAGELERMQNDARLKELIATKDNFYDIVTHDLKNRFTSILGSSELLYSNIDHMSLENIRKIALILNDSSKNGYSMIQNLLDWSRSQAGLLLTSPERINLRNLINDNIENLKMSAVNKEINLIYESPEQFIIFADEYLINVILRNLISNAIKFTRKGGKVIIKTYREPDDIIISVKDNGIGIPMEKVENLFSLKFRSSSSGIENELVTGLGLKLCQEFVEKINGKIWVKSIENKGSEFLFSIPLNAAK